MFTRNTVKYTCGISMLKNFTKCENSSCACMWMCACMLKYINNSIYILKFHLLSFESVISGDNAVDHKFIYVRRKMA